MKNTMLRLLASRWVWVLLLLVPIAAAFLIFRSPSDGAFITAAVVWFGLLAVGIVALLANLAGLDPQSAQIAEDITSNELKQRLVERWLRRSRHYRYVGGAVGFVVGLGFVDNGGLEMVYGLFAGIALGGALAELHVLRPRSAGVRAADLTSRELRDYTSPSDTFALVAIAVVGLATCLAAVLTTEASTGRSVALSVVAITIVALTYGLQRVVTTRPRPAVTQELRDADDLLRHLAATQGFARPAIAVSLMTLALAVGALGTNELLDLAAFAIGLAGVIWYVRSRQTAVIPIARSMKASQIA